MTDYVCTHCGTLVARYITKGPYCSVSCKDQADNAGEIADMKDQTYTLRQLLQAAGKKDAAEIERLQAENALQHAGLAQAVTKIARLQAESDRQASTIAAMMEACVIPHSDAPGAMLCLLCEAAGSPLHNPGCILADPDAAATALLERLANAEARVETNAECEESASKLLDMVFALEPYAPAPCCWDEMVSAIERIKERLAKAEECDEGCVRMEDYARLSDEHEALKERLRIAETGIVFEDQLPADIEEATYNEWFKLSWLSNGYSGVRVGLSLVIVERLLLADAEIAEFEKNEQATNDAQCGMMSEIAALTAEVADLHCKLLESADECGKAQRTLDAIRTAYESNNAHEIPAILAGVKDSLSTGGQPSQRIGGD